MEKKVTFEEINLIAEKLAEIVKKDETIALIGDLGTGKTTFVKVFAKKIGIREIVKSPTFNIVHEYHSGSIPLFHFDVYRLASSDELYEIGFDDYINNNGIKLIEWSDLIEQDVPEQYIEIKLFHNDDTSRIIDISYHGEKEREGEILGYVGLGN